MRRKFSRRVFVLAVLVLGAAVLVAAMALFARHPAKAEAGPESIEASSVSTKGKLVKIGKRQEARLRRAGLTPVYLMAVRGKHSYYRIGSLARGTCYGVGKTGSLAGPGLTKCWASARPIMDLSVVEITRASPKPRLIDAGGIVADGVASVAFAMADGQVLAEAAVIGNTYDFAQVPPEAQVIEARDSAGRVVFSHTLGSSQ